MSSEFSVEVWISSDDDLTDYYGVEMTPSLADNGNKAMNLSRPPVQLLPSTKSETLWSALRAAKCGALTDTLNAAELSSVNKAYNLFSLWGFL